MKKKKAKIKLNKILEVRKEELHKSNKMLCFSSSKAKCLA